MKAEMIYEQGPAQWIAFGRDPDKPEHVIDTNEYIITVGSKTLIMDPGGTEIFPEVVTAISDYVNVEDIRIIFGSHQDPDILSSLSLWMGLCKQAKVYVPWTWTHFISHFGCEPERMIGVPDEGQVIELDQGYEVEIVPAHYLHASGNNHLYDPQAKILFSGDVGAALLPPDKQGLYVQDFEDHTQYMKAFHQRWMPSNRARDVWVERVRGMDIELMCPQHGSIFKGEDVTRFLDWFSELELGVAVSRNEENRDAA